MKWIIFLIVGVMSLSLGVVLIIIAPIIPVYYTATGTSINLTNGTVVPGGFTPSYYEILVPTIPNTLHLRINGKQDLHVELINPNGNIALRWQNSIINEDYDLTEVGLWKLNISAPTETNFQAEIFTTAPITAHPALIYASGAILLGTLTLLYSKNKRTHESFVGDVLFEQNIAGRWIFAVWIPLFAFIAYAPRFIPSYPWLYFILIVLTVIALFSCLSLAYIKLYVLTKGILIETPFLNFSRYYSVDQIYGFNITKEKKQRWFLLYPIPSFRTRKENFVTISLLEPLPRILQALVFGERFVGNTIKFKPKSFQRFITAMNTLGIRKREITKI